MIIGYFTERPYRWVPEEEVLRNEAFFAVSNKYFDREKAADDYNYFLDEYCYAEDMGFDALMLNEHHGNPFCMGSVMNVEASILARITKKAKIVLIGNPLPVLKHPLRMAEELAEIDLISRGRLVAGWVRGAGSEQFFNNANPAYNREYFNEAHDFIIQAWTKPGPWRYEGKHFHYRHVNPWALPYQKPHPQMWIPGVLSPETVRWCAEHAYPYIGLVTNLSPTCDLWDFYADIAAEKGYQAGPENFGYLMGVFVADTDEKAQELGKEFVFGGGASAFSRPEHTLPPGYNSKDAIRRLSRLPGGGWVGVSADRLKQSQEGKGAPEGKDYAEIRRKLLVAYEKAQKSYLMIVGSPKTVTEKLKTIVRVLRPGIFTVFQVQGMVSNEDRKNSIRLFAQEVLPAMKAYAKEIDLPDPFERFPGSVKLQPGTKRAPVSDRTPLAALNLKDE
jgi:alkanesulfonate monooxygenase SsuD/methylene tetrahydromethanopterin reductase-like flavin-dependent oxidoreductase (luciferase family)